MLESRPLGLWSLDAYLAQRLEQKTTAYSCVVSLVHAGLAQLHQDLEPGQGFGARKSWKAGLLDFGPWMHISGTGLEKMPLSACATVEDGWTRTGTRNQDKEPGPGTRQHLEEELEKTVATTLQHHDGARGCGAAGSGMPAHRG